MHCWISCLLNISKANSQLIENNIDYITSDKRRSLDVINSVINLLRKAHLNIKVSISEYKKYINYLIILKVCYIIYTRLTHYYILILL